MQTIKLREAIAQMRILTKLNAPFSFGFITYSELLQKSEGYKQVNQALLRKGYRDEQSNKANILIAYDDHTQLTEKPRQFYLPLLMMFNNKRVIP